MKKYDVVALGELLIDFTENDISAQGDRKRVIQCMKQILEEHHVMF